MEATPLIIPLLPSDISHYHPFLDFFNATCTSKAEEFDEIQLFIIVVYVIRGGRWVSFAVENT